MSQSTPVHHEGEAKNEKPDDDDTCTDSNVESVQKNNGKGNDSKISDVDKKKDGKVHESKMGELEKKEKKEGKANDSKMSELDKKDKKETENERKNEKGNEEHAEKKLKSKQEKVKEEAEKGEKERKRESAKSENRKKASESPEPKKDSEKHKTDKSKGREKKNQKGEKKEKEYSLRTTGLNLDSMIASKKKYREAVKSAKQEEQMYVKFRVKNILENHQPEILKKKKKNKLDDSFPRVMKEAANANLEGSMAFGMRKAHFLSIRPNPRYATWFGKAKGAKGVKGAKPVTKNKKSPAVKAEKANEKKTETYRPAVEAVEEVRHGVNENCPLDKEGNPFWFETEDPPEDEDEFFVNIDVMEKVQKGQIKVPEPLPPRKKFDPDDNMPNFYKSKRYFERKIVFFNTIRNIMKTHTERVEQKKESAPGKESEKKVVFADKMSLSSYDNNRPKKEWEIGRIEPLKEIIKKPPEDDE